MAYLCHVTGAFRTIFLLVLIFQENQKGEEDLFSKSTAWESLSNTGMSLGITR